MSVHAHTHNKKSVKKNLIIAIIINIIITGSELVAGFLSSSYALITDAAHNFSDVLALMLSVIGIYLLSFKNTSDRTYGYRRVELMIGLINSLALIVIGGIIIKGSIALLISPNTVTGLPVIIFSVMSAVLNGVCVVIIESSEKTHAHGHSVSIKSSVLHLFSDMLTSVAVCIGGIIILFWEIYWVDPLISIVIGVYIIWTSLKIIKYSMSLLLNFAPSHIDIYKLQTIVQNIDGVVNMHHLHIWQLSESEVHLEAHVSTDKDYSLSEVHVIQKHIETVLSDSFNIRHTTLQFEFNSDCKEHLIYGYKVTS